jgi:DNA repair exonuclease SbcCD ATPase subunit
MEDIKQIEEYKQQIELLKEEQKKIDKERENLQLRWCETNQEIYAFEKKINAIEADRFREECKKGLHKELKFNELPHDLSLELMQIEKEISCGCTGDWEVGCRGCIHECSRRAKEKFMQKYNIEKIVY